MLGASANNATTPMQCHKMNKFTISTAAILCLCYGVLPADEPTEAVESPNAASIRQRIEGRHFPSVFQAWSPADNLEHEDKYRTLARHDLVWHGASFFGLTWNHEHRGLAVGLEAQSVVRAKALRRHLLGLNPNLILIAEIRYRDAHRSYLPEGHKWWLRDEDGRIVPGWREGQFLCLDFHNPDFREQVAAQVKALAATGVVDGVLLDWWADGDDRLELVKTVRNAIGEDLLILANANDRKTPRTAPYINGYFMECYRSQTADDWQRIADTLSWAEANLRQPRVNCLETWYHDSRDDLHLMRAATTLSLTHSNGYCLFSDPNPLPTADHRHNWYPFWEKRLGRPTAAGRSHQDGTTRREFERGTAVYNPPGNGAVTVTFPQSRTSPTTGVSARAHRLAALDGDIYLCPAGKRE